MAKTSKKMPRRNRPPPKGSLIGFAGLGWELLVFGSFALNLVAIALFASPSLDRGATPLGFDSEGSVAEAALVASPHLDGQKEKMVSAEEEISVSSTSGSLPASKDAVINLDHGDPTMYESFWKGMGNRGDITIAGWQAISYFSDVTNLCWFLEPEFDHEIRRLHRLVGNAIADNHFVIVGTGSTQLFQAALYALSPPDTPEPLSVVSAVPYYSSYPAVTDYLRSGLYRWAGDASAFKGNAYIELVCSPNNPDGSIREAVLNSEKGMTIYDLAYYWPQYTPITRVEDHDIMLFTVSKTTGHAGSRIGWALVRDKDVAKRMIKFVELNSIGVSKDSQLRAAKIFKAISDGYELPNPENKYKLFNFGRQHMSMRWNKLREAVKVSGIFSLPEFQPSHCRFTRERTETYPAFAWLKCEKEGVEDCESFLRSHKILSRNGKYFGADRKYVRISMLDRDDTFDLFVERLSSLT
ncbi:tryptophan aminotransferase-related protein 1-like [Curcuma longa]|uniref:tryptophan aminotransferase-related protein 1-like n=1 Tax=Curcuma longa TaxID=136217 RepID=UPI003D9E723E